MLFRTLFTVAASLLALCFTHPALAQDNGITVTLTPQHKTVVPGQNTVVAVTFEFTNHLHVWPNKPVTPKGLESFSLDLTPTVAVPAPGAELPPGVKVLNANAQWPAGKPLSTAALGADTIAIVYHDTTTAYVPVKIDASAAHGKVTIPLVVKFQACNETMCFPPEDRELTVSFDIGAATVPADVPAGLFAGFNAATAYADPPPSPSAAAGPTVIDLGVFGWKVTLDGAVGYALLFIVALAGGFILNLTPCVLPVIPLKILGLQSQAGTRSRMLFLGFVMFCGLVFFWLTIGLLLAVGVLGAISEISSYWQFNMLIAVFMSVMGLGMFGLFTVGLPTWVYNIDVKHDSAAGSFGFGIMSAVLATPCVAPLVGGIAAGATKLPTVVGLLLFVFVGIGMGLPYLILAAYPRLIAWLPRAGPGSELLKQVLGLLMIAVSFFFLGSALITLVAEYPWLAKQLHWWAVAIAVAIATGWLILRTFQITPSVGKRFVFTLLGLLLTLGAFAWANTQTKIGEVAWDRAEQARRDQEKLAPGVVTDQLWQDYTAAKVETTLAEGKAVVMDFTAEWCGICKTLEATVLHTSDVEAALNSGGVRSFIVDLTSKKAEGWQRLKDLGQKGVPTLAIMGPGLKEPWVRNAYTISEVVEAIKQAKGSAGGDTAKATAARP